ncbi:hypothetical protein EV182_007444 [Spiromyces aspiralis]|uniref:Uncharacterized protein n=1 Tax=Spiromyces aspiralis TaxID=68401 RepID=A0ACC1HED2_9FUNG|nr:hypothetical protein EV182_007444 [Spiromyces aspiralis]
MFPFLAIPEILEFSASADQSVHDFIESIDSYISYLRTTMINTKTSDQALPVFNLDRLAIQQAIARTSGAPKRHLQVWSRSPGITWCEIKGKLAEQFPYTLGAREVFDRLNSITREKEESFTLFLERFKQVAARSRQSIPSDLLLEIFLGRLPHTISELYLCTHEKRSIDSLRDFLTRRDKDAEYMRNTQGKVATHTAPSLTTSESADTVTGKQERLESSEIHALIDEMQKLRIAVMQGLSHNHKPRQPYCAKCKVYGHKTYLCTANPDNEAYNTHEQGKGAAQ